MAGRRGGASAVAGILDLHIIQADDLPNLCSYGPQDVYAKVLCGSDRGDSLSGGRVALSTRTVKSGGSNPIFNQRLQVGVPERETELKCEIWMASHNRGTADDQPLGYVHIPLSKDVMDKSKAGEKEYALIPFEEVVGTQLASAGRVKIALAYHPRNGSGPNTNGITPPPSLPAKPANSHAGSFLGRALSAALSRISAEKEQQRQQQQLQQQNSLPHQSVGHGAFPSETFPSETFQDFPFSTGQQQAQVFRAGSSSSEGTYGSEPGLPTGHGHGPLGADGAIQAACRGVLDMKIGVGTERPLGPQGGGVKKRKSKSGPIVAMTRTTYSGDYGPSAKRGSSPGPKGELETSALEQLLQSHIELQQQGPASAQAEVDDEEDELMMDAGQHCQQQRKIKAKSGPLLFMHSDAKGSGTRHPSTTYVRPSSVSPTPPPPRVLLPPGQPWAPAGAPSWPSSPQHPGSAVHPDSTEEQGGTSGQWSNGTVDVKVNPGMHPPHLTQIPTAPWAHSGDLGLSARLSCHGAPGTAKPEYVTESNPHHDGVSNGTTVPPEESSGIVVLPDGPTFDDLVAADGSGPLDIFNMPIPAGFDTVAWDPDPDMDFGPLEGGQYGCSMMDGTDDAMEVSASYGGPDEAGFHVQNAAVGSSEHGSSRTANPWEDSASRDSSHAGAESQGSHVLPQHSCDLQEVSGSATWGQPGEPSAGATLGESNRLPPPELPSRRMASTAGRSGHVGALYGPGIAAEEALQSGGVQQSRWKQDYGSPEMQMMDQPVPLDSPGYDHVADMARPSTPGGSLKSPGLFQGKTPGSKLGGRIGNLMGLTRNGSNGQLGGSSRLWQRRQQPASAIRQQPQQQERHEVQQQGLHDGHSQQPSSMHPHLLQMPQPQHLQQSTHAQMASQQHQRPVSLGLEAEGPGQQAHQFAPAQVALQQEAQQLPSVKLSKDNLFLPSYQAIAGARLSRSGPLLPMASLPVDTPANAEEVAMTAPEIRGESPLILETAGPSTVELPARSSGFSGGMGNGIQRQRPARPVSGPLPSPRQPIGSLQGPALTSNAAWSTTFSPSQPVAPVSHVPAQAQAASAIKQSGSPSPSPALLHLPTSFAVGSGHPVPQQQQQQVQPLQPLTEVPQQQLQQQTPPAQGSARGARRRVIPGSFTAFLAECQAQKQQQHGTMDSSPGSAAFQNTPSPPAQVPSGSMHAVPQPPQAGLRQSPGATFPNTPVGGLQMPPLMPGDATQQMQQHGVVASALPGSENPQWQQQAPQQHTPVLCNSGGAGPGVPGAGWYENGIPARPFQFSTPPGGPNEPVGVAHY